MIVGVSISPSWLVPATWISLSLSGKSAAEPSRYWKLIGTNGISGLDFQMTSKSQSCG